jgi:hypothetical protein
MDVFLCNEYVEECNQIIAGDLRSSLHRSPGGVAPACFAGPFKIVAVVLTSTGWWIELRPTPLMV